MITPSSGSAARTISEQQVVGELAQHRLGILITPGCPSRCQADHRVLRRVIVGDVRSLALLDAFHVELEKLSRSVWAPATGSRKSGLNTPTSWRSTPAGFESGPSRLKMVRVASSTRVGPTFFIAG